MGTRSIVGGTSVAVMLMSGNGQRRMGGKRRRWPFHTLRWLPWALLHHRLSSFSRWTSEIDEPETEIFCRTDPHTRDFVA